MQDPVLVVQVLEAKDQELRHRHHIVEPQRHLQAVQEADRQVHGLDPARRLEVPEVVDPVVPQEVPKVVQAVQEVFVQEVLEVQAQAVLRVVCEAVRAVLEVYALAQAVLGVYAQEVPRAVLEVYAQEVPRAVLEVYAQAVLGVFV